jgi:hypothetical protein
VKENGMWSPIGVVVAEEALAEREEPAVAIAFGNEILE